MLSTCHLLFLCPMVIKLPTTNFNESVLPGENKWLRWQENRCSSSSNFYISLQRLKLMQCENYYSITEES